MWIGADERPKVKEIACRQKRKAQKHGRRRKGRTGQVSWIGNMREPGEEAG